MKLQSTVYDNNIKECFELNWWTIDSLITLEETNEEFLTSQDHLRDAAAAEIRFCFWWQMVPYEIQDDFKTISRNFINLERWQTLVRKKDEKLIRIDNVLSENDWKRKKIAFTNHKKQRKEIVIDRYVDLNRWPLPSTTVEYEWKIYKSAKDHWDVWNHTIMQREHVDELIFKPMVEAWMLWPIDRRFWRNYFTIHDMTETYSDWSWDVFAWLKNVVVEGKTEEEVLEIMMKTSGLYTPQQIALNKEMVSFMEWEKKNFHWAIEKPFYLEAALNMYEDSEFCNWWILTAADVFAYQLWGFSDKKNLVHMPILVDSPAMSPVPLWDMPWSKEFFMKNQNTISQLVDEVKSTFTSLPLEQRRVFNKNKKIPYNLTKKFREEFPEKRHLSAASRDRVNSLYSDREKLQTYYSNIREL